MVEDDYPEERGADRGVQSCDAFNSCPSHDDVGGFFFDFGAIRTESSAQVFCTSVIWSNKHLLRLERGV